MAATNSQSNYRRIDNILQVNDDCLFVILQNLSAIELCNVAETCKCFQHVAREVFMRRREEFFIPQEKISFKDHSRILRNFGNLIQRTFMDIYLSDEMFLTSTKVVQAFNWLERYCGDTLQQLVIFCYPACNLPPDDLPSSVLTPSAKRLMSKLKTICIFSYVKDETARTLFADCKEVVELDLMLCDFFYTDHRFPHLRKLSNSVRVGYDTDFKNMETFFERHSELVALRIQFHLDHVDCTIDLSFIAYLVNLQKLELEGMKRANKIIGVDAFAKLIQLKELSVGDINCWHVDASILESVTSIDSLVAQISLSSANSTKNMEKSLK